MKRSKDDEDVLADAGNVVPLSGRKKPPSRKGIPATDAQKAALKKGTNKARAKAKERREREAREGGRGKSRWHQLLDGDINVEDLETEELQRMQTKDAIGAFGGRAPQVPHRLARAMKAELLNRGQAIIDGAYTDAVTLLHDIVKDRKARHGDRIKAAQLIVERSAGRMPETVRVEKAQTWDETFEDGVIVVNNDGQETG